MLIKSVLMRRWAAALIALVILGISGVTALAATFLPPEQAFQLETQLRDPKTLVIAWVIAPGYHLYRERLEFQTADAGVVLGAPKLPDGLREFDKIFNREVETYKDHLVVELPIAQVDKADRTFVVNISYQGCADAGLCYPPKTQAFQVNLTTLGKLMLATPAMATEANAAPSSVSTAAANANDIANVNASVTAPAVSAKKNTPEASEDDSSLAQRTLQSGSVWKIGSAFLLFGLLLSFTPCVLPMVPILSSIIVGDGAAVSRGRGFLLALAYCLGMALVYTSLGVAAGMAGEGLAGALQKPAVLLTFGALLVGLALSMFDVYQLQLPGALQSRLSQTSGALRGGRFVGVFVMGALSALIVGPCVAGPLAGALLYISQTRNVWTGGWALFSMAVGMSVPLLLTGLSAGTLLPRAGAWMNQVKRLFGLLLIAVAIWMISPVFSVVVMMAIWGGFAILCAVFFHVLEPLRGTEPRNYLAKALGLIFLFGGAFELLGAASSGTDVLQPLAHFHLSSAARSAITAPDGVATEGTEVKFTRIHTVAELDQILTSTKIPVMLDFYADWCVSCKEMERYTFSDQKVSERLKSARLIQADVTANSDADRALLKRFNLFGPPGIIMFNATGQEVPQTRVIGFLEPEPFLQRLRNFLAA